MSDKKLHPSVREFKAFVANNPHLIKEVRNGRATWQQLYEEWYLLGEDDPRWNQASQEVEEKTEAKESGNKDWMGHLSQLAKKMDPAQFQSHLYNLSQALGAVQGLIGQFSKNPVQDAPPREIAPPSPFPFRKD